MGGSVSVHPDDIKMLGSQGLSDLSETDAPPIPPPEITDTIDDSSCSTFYEGATSSTQMNEATSPKRSKCGSKDRLPTIKNGKCFKKQAVKADVNNVRKWLGKNDPILIPDSDISDDEIDVPVNTRKPQIQILSVHRINAKQKITETQSEYLIEDGSDTSETSEVITRKKKNVKKPTKNFETSEVVIRKKENVKRPTKNFMSSRFKNFCVICRAIELHDFKGHIRKKHSVGTLRTRLKL